MNPLAPSEARPLVAKIKQIATKLKRTKVVICPPAIFLPLFTSHGSRKVVFGAQDVFPERRGAYTGAISAEMFRYLGAHYSIIGHSERRAAGDTDEMVNRKLKAAMRAGLTPILCVGEKERDQQGNYLNFIRTQVESALLGMTKKISAEWLIVYEPVWAIGKTAKDSDTPADFLEKKLFIRKIISNLMGAKLGREVPILYGGSVEPKNAFGFLQEGEADGLLVGHSSLRADHFGEILKTAEAWKA